MAKRRKKNTKTAKKKECESPIESLLRFVEKDRVGLFGAFLVITVLACLRSIGESSLFNYVQYTVYLCAAHEALYFALFMTGTFLITWVSGVSGRKIFNVIIFGWWIIVIPPIIDYFLGYGQTGMGYPYPKHPDPIKQIIDFFDINYIKKLGIGEMTQLWSVTILPGIYVLLRKKSPLRAFLSSLSIFLFIVYIAVAMNFIKNIDYLGNTAYIVLFGSIYQPIYGDYYLGLTEDQAAFLIQQQIFLFVVLYYTVMFLISSALFLYVYSKERTLYFFRSIDIKRIIFAFSAVVLGFAVPRIMVMLGKIIHCAIYPEYFLHFVYVGIAMISMLMAAQVWNMMEKLNSEDRWDAPYTKNQYRNVMLAFSFISLSMAYLLGTGPFLLDVLFLFIAYLYSYPPFEGKKTSLAPFIFGFYGLIPFLFAYYTPTYWLIKIWGPHFKIYDPSMLAEIHVPVSHPLYPEVIVSAVVVYVVAVIWHMLKRRE